MAISSNRSVGLIAILAALILAVVWASTLSDGLVVYCAHDAVYSKQILDDFTRQTGIRVQVRFDTEATKSLGLINLIMQERNQPRCDVFWNNELLGNVELKQQGMLEPYQGSGWKRIPDRYRDAEGYWVGFGARMRVCIFGERVKLTDEQTFDRFVAEEPGRVAIAKPLFGTTLTHYTVMWHLCGPDQLKKWHEDLHSKGVREVDGNAAVKDIVATGTCDAGLTDTDDYFVAVDDRQSVSMQAARIKSTSPNDSGKQAAADQKADFAGYTICIPNTVAIIKGTKRLAAAQRLVDFLASAETELSLARAKSRQIPLGPVDSDSIPEDVRGLIPASQDGVDLRPLLDARRECLKWLQSEYLK